jgi:hypothetical protein
MITNRFLVACLVFPVLIAIDASCGGSSSAPPTGPTPAPTATPTPAPTVAPLFCDPTPPPLRYVGVKIHDDSGYRKILDSKPVVQNVDRYCQRVGVPGNEFCSTRLEDDPQRADCDRMAMGMSDTGRYGPTWSYEGQPCRDRGPEPGCYHHPDNQFLVIAKGTGEFAACAAADAPVDPEEGARCGYLEVTSTAGP